jgi:hypothetical protein
MKRFAVVALALLAAVLPAAGFAAAPLKQPVVTGFYRGHQVSYFDFGPIKLKPGNKLAPIWTVTNGAAGQHNIVDTVPGASGYSPLWLVSKVTFKAGVTPRLLKSKADVDAAVRNGDVTVTQTSTVVNCPVLGFGQASVTGFSSGHRIHYYDLGPVKVAAGNVVAPLFTVTNPVGPQQHNVTEENVAAGQTKYPPLWGIMKVTFKQGVKPRLITSYAEIEKAQAAGDVTVTRTRLVVNCPVVA